MTARTWLGGGNNKASNPADWSPSGLPRPGDSLTMTQGTINISGNATAGDVLDVSLKAGLDATIHLSGILTMTADVIGSHLDTFGGTIRFIGSNSFTTNDEVVFNSNLIGSATLAMSGFQGAGSHVEVNGFVGRGLTFGFNSGSPVTSMQIDHPHEFFGQLDLPPSPGLGFVAFMGLHATSADLRDDLLLMFNGRRLVDATRVVGGSDLQLQQNSRGVMLSEGFETSVQPGGPGAVIPLHIS